MEDKDFMVVTPARLKRMQKKLNNITDQLESLREDISQIQLSQYKGKSPHFGDCIEDIKDKFQKECLKDEAWQDANEKVKREAMEDLAKDGNWAAHMERIKKAGEWIKNENVA